MTVALSVSARTLLDAPNFAVVATLNPDGSPNTAVVAIARDGDTVLISTVATRRLARNLARDSRVSLSIFDLSNPLHSISIRGTVELTDDTDKTTATRVAYKYSGSEPQPEPAEWRRLSVRINPDRIYEKDLSKS